MKKKNNRNRGVTLFEVMIAVALFAIIITPVMNSFITAIKVNMKSRQVMIATDVAQSIMEGYSGKTYVDVWKGMQLSVSPFTYDGDTANGKWAFSTINEGFFNHGHSKELGTAGFPATYISDITNEGYTLSPIVADLDINKVISTEAVRSLKASIASEGRPLDPYLDTAEGSAKPYEASDGRPLSTDKLIYFGRSEAEYVAATGEEAVPMMIYMVYNRIQKDNHFYDAVVSFTPNAQNAGKDALDNDWLVPGTTDVKNDDYFSYKVRVTVYEYQYYGNDPVTGDPLGLSEDGALWPSRFETVNGVEVFEGAPVAIMESGIQYK